MSQIHHTVRTRILEYSTEEKMAGDVRGVNGHPRAPIPPREDATPSQKEHPVIIDGPPAEMPSETLFFDAGEQFPGRHAPLELLPSTTTGGIGAHF
jgi:hypothetical protein